MSNSVTSIAAVRLSAPGQHAEQSAAALLAEGWQHFDQAQFGAAKTCFAGAVDLEPGNREAQQALSFAYQAIVPRWHFAMLNDEQRNTAYDNAIRTAVDDDSVVLDVGSGSGLLAMMAARAGARKVYTCEVNEVVADIANVVIADNGFADAIKVIAKRSDQIVLGEDMSEKANLLITETLDSALLGEGVASIVLDARARLLVDGAHIIPRGAKMYATLLESRDVWDMNNVTDAAGFDVRAFNALRTDGAYPVRLARFDYEFLAAPLEMCTFDFMLDDPAPRSFDLPFEVSRSGHCHAVAFWYDLELDDDNSFKISVDNEDSHWKQAISCFDEPVLLEAGQSCTLGIQQGLTSFAFHLRK